MRALCGVAFVASTGPPRDGDLAAGYHGGTFGSPPVLLELLVIVMVTVTIARAWRLVKEWHQHRWQWSIADWFNATFWIAVLLAIVFSR